VELVQYFRDDAHNVNQSFRSIALYGAEGAGKSTTVLQYVQDKIKQSELDALFWVKSEKDVTLRQNFSDVALRLKLPGPQPKNHAQNRSLVLNWLQTTSKF
jgi:GTPase SAR1 family protein